MPKGRGGLADVNDIRFLRPQLPSLAEVGRYFAAAEKERWFSNLGPCHRLLTQRLSSFVGEGALCVLVGNATLGLMVALRALLDRSSRDAREVIVPSFTFAAVVDAITWCGLEPVFADLEAETWHLDPEQLELAIEKRGNRLAAVLACSTFGTAPPLAVRQRWQAACAAANIPLLVDSAAGFGTLDEARQPLGRQGDAEVFSFHATKPFGMGEGGLIVTEDADLAAEMSLLINFGLDDRRAPFRTHGINAKLSEIHAAIGLAVLDGYDDVLECRRSLAWRIRRPLESAGFSFQPASERSTWQFIPTLAPSREARDAVLDHAESARVELRTYFAPPLHESPPFASSQRLNPLPVTKDFVQRILSLPLANDLTDGEVDRIIKSVLGAVAAPGSRPLVEATG
jgi:dTDP-4-amino-4,6-dideoxygalactose transaminase